MKEIKLEYLLFIFLVLTSCGALVKGVASGQLTEKKGAIPPDFGKDNTSVMVFITHETLITAQNNFEESVTKGDE